VAALEQKKRRKKRGKCLWGDERWGLVKPIKRRGRKKNQLKRETTFDVPMRLGNKEAENSMDKGNKDQGKEF